MNTHLIKISGSVEVEKPLSMDKEYKYEAIIDCRSITKKTNDNGEFTFIYNAKPRTAEITDNGERLSIPSQKGSLSQQNQQMLAQFWKHEIRDKSEAEFLKTYGTWWEIVSEKQPEILQELKRRLCKQE